MMIALSSLITAVWLLAALLLLCCVAWMIKVLLPWHYFVTAYWWIWQRRRNHLDDRAMWRVYPEPSVDPATGELTYGIELVAPDGLIVSDQEMRKLPENASVARRLAATEQAMDRAGALNRERNPARCRQWRLAEEETE